MAGLSTEQQEFIAGFTQVSGLDPGVVAAWIVSEVGRGIRYSPGHRDFNYLNIGNTNSGWHGGSFWADKNPFQAGALSAGWMMGRVSVPGFGRADPRIRNIANTRGRSPNVQMAALVNSPWERDHYSALGGLSGMMGLYREFAHLSRNLAGARSQNAMFTPPAGPILPPLSGGLDEIPSPGDVAGGVGDALDAVGDVASVIGKFVDMITDVRFWIRVGQAIAGMVLIGMGLKELGKTSGAGGAAARAGSKVASAPKKAARAGREAALAAAPGGGAAKAASRAGKMRKAAKAAKAAKNVRR